MLHRQIKDVLSSDPTEVVLEREPAMSPALKKTFSRLWSLDAGIAMVVTDLHGDWDAYRRYRDCFVDLQAKHQADYLICAGDLIYSEQNTKQPE